eukprot:1073883-Rhodomonas_salina.1
MPSGRGLSSGLASSCSLRQLSTGPRTTARVAPYALSQYRRAHGVRSLRTAQCRSRAQHHTLSQCETPHCTCEGGSKRTLAQYHTPYIAP